MKYKTLLTRLMTLIKSFQPFATTETKTKYYLTGEVKTGEVKEVQEYVDGKSSKVTIYHKNGEVKNIRNY